MVVTVADVPDWGNHTDWPLHKFGKALIAMGLRENFLLARRVFWGAAVWNFRYFRDSAAARTALHGGCGVCCFYKGRWSRCGQALKQPAKHPGAGKILATGGSEEGLEEVPTQVCGFLRLVKRK
jgi:hypothetical protein